MKLDNLIIEKHIEVKATSEQPVELSYREIFYQIKNSMQNQQMKNFSNKILNKRGRAVFIFPQLIRVGISEFEDFEREILAVYNKKSTQSANIRELLKKLFIQIQIVKQNGTTKTI